MAVVMDSGGGNGSVIVVGCYGFFASYNFLHYFTGNQTRDKHLKHWGNHNISQALHHSHACGNKHCLGVNTDKLRINQTWAVLFAARRSLFGDKKTMLSVMINTTNCPPRDKEKNKTKTMLLAKGV